MRDIRILCAVKSAAPLISSFTDQCRALLTPTTARSIRALLAYSALAATSLFAVPPLAQESICAEVKIEIKQKLSLERQAFDAVLQIKAVNHRGLL